LIEAKVPDCCKYKENELYEARKSFCNKYIPFLEKIQKDFKLKEWCSNYSDSHSNPNNKEVEQTIKTLLEEAYKTGMVVENDELIINSLDQHQIDSLNEKYIISLSYDEILGIISYKFRTARICEGRIIRDSLASGSLLLLFKTFVLKERQSSSSNNVKIVCTSIVDDNLLKEADAVVNATNPYMIYGSGVCGAIFKKAGVKELENYCKRTYEHDMVVGEIRITPGFNLPCDIIFAQGPRVYDYKEYNLAELDLLNTYKNLLNASLEKGYKSIILPSLGTGVYGFKHEKVASKVLTLLKSEEYRTLKIFFVNNDRLVCDLYEEILERL